MVSTRNHPKTFPTPSKPDADSSSPISPSSTPTPSLRGRPRKPLSASTSINSSKSWSHTPSNLTLLWLAISLPLVFWDTGYVLLRPHTMPGGKLHSPIWTPYALYGTVDYIYGLRAWEARNGFTAAQGVMNLVESAGYLLYLWVVLRAGVEVEGVGRGSLGARGWLARPRKVAGQAAGWAVLVGFAAAVGTVSKTVLYWLNEYFSGFDNIGHNDALSLLFLWIIPNGAWLVVPSYMIYVFGSEILEGLAIASGERTSSIKQVLAIKDE